MTTMEEWDTETYASYLPSIPEDAHKYSRGSVLVIAGSRRFPGAAILSALAAARTGAGYVSLAVPQSMVSVAQTHLLSIPVVGVPEEDGAFSGKGIEALLKRIPHVDAIILGPGLTVTKGTQALVVDLLRQTPVPLLVDADALNALAANTIGPSAVTDELLNRSNTAAPLVFTPHTGEMNRLLEALGEISKVEPAEVSTHTHAYKATLLAKTLDVTVVAKGHTTVIAQGDRLLFSSYGTPALATAGTGDVLAGMIGSLLAQGLEAFEAAAVGVYVHSRAGCIAERINTTRGTIAEDVLHAIPAALHEIEKAKRTEA